jgi:hypothetical protein
MDTSNQSTASDDRKPLVIERCDRFCSSAFDVRVIE